ncbi:hypothetical protein [Segatella copri]|uniref:Lipocalin-like domain-containing protein n=1 Tax=Segatella copri TaxID=165179 RepID=A0AAW5IED5_9BACT|nr:hypothetical protein [Segatella copri]MCP9547664.1 hypothetical protein [Segatella copri]MCP9550895.1 hypothetical protein [Segatella copri]MCP9557077.1 hypothetical protein [Segatella copri]MCP9571760.1 hypothetical protein [Segatella copri]
MKKLLTLVAAAFMAVNVSAANKVLKITGTADNPGEPHTRQCFINLKNVQKGKPNVVKFDVYTSSDTEFEIGTEAIDDSQTAHKDQWNNSAVFSYTDGLTITKDRKEVAVHFPGKTTVDCATHKDKLENFEYAASALLLNIGKLPKDAILYIDNVKVYDEEDNLLFSEDFENATVAKYDKTKTAYFLEWQGGANFEIADENATYIPSVDLANLDFSNGATAIGGWGGGFTSEIIKDDGVDVDRITFTKQELPYNVQVDFENVYPKDAKIQLTMEAKGSVAGSIKAGLQNPDNYRGCGDFEDINLTTGYQTFIKTVTCSGDNARRLLLNVGTYGGTISIKSVKIVALDVPEEIVTISPSGYSTYAAYYPVDYSKLDDLKAYTVKLNAEKTGIVMNEVEGVVPAGVAVLLKGKAKTDYRLAKAEGLQDQDVTSDLKLSDGTITSTTEKTVYGLATVKGQDGFYKASNGKTIPAKCAYLEVKNSANPAKFYSLGDHSGSTTGITSVKNEAAGNNAPMYNLAGQLVDKGYKGIVIKNGKKIVLK